MIKTDINKFMQPPVFFYEENKIRKELFNRCHPCSIFFASLATLGIKRAKF